MAQIWSEKGILIFVFYFYGTFFTSFFFAIHPTNTRNRIKNGRKTEKWKKRQRQEIKMKWNREKEKEKNWSVRKKKLKMQRVCLSDSGHMTRNNFSRNQTRCTSICILYLWSQRVKLVSMWKKKFLVGKSFGFGFFYMQCNSPSSADFSAEVNCESYFNADSYGTFSTSRCRPCTNWKTPQIPTRKKSTFLTFADLTQLTGLQSISIMLEIRFSMLITIRSTTFN